MKIIRDKTLKVIPSSAYEQQIIEDLLKHNCLHENPKYQKMLQTKRYQKGISKFIQTYKFEKGAFHFYKANYPVYNQLFNLNLPIEGIKDNRVSNKIDLELKLSPRDDEQRKAIFILYEFMQGFGYNCLSAMPAAGKTYMACNLMTKLKEKTLILVDMGLLVDQFVESITKFTTIKEDEIGFIRGGQIDYKDKKIIIAMAQTLHKQEKIMKELSEEIGFVICDECHVWSAETFQRILPNFKPKYQLGLSGSHDRDDAMDFLVKEAIGPIVHEVDKQSLIDSGSVIKPILRPILLLDEHKFNKYKGNDDIDFRTVVEEYYNCPKVINKISNMVLHYMKAGRSQLLICKEKTMVNSYYETILKKILGEQFVFNAELDLVNKRQQKEAELIKTDVTSACELFATEKDKNGFTEGELNKKYADKKQKLLTKLNKELEKINKMKWFETDYTMSKEEFGWVEIITGDITKKERDRIIEEANAGKIKVILTSTVMDKGISINRLDTLYLLFSTRERANTIQRVGRIGRSFEGKKDAIVFDFIYLHFMSLYQFSNKKGDCRLKAHEQVTYVHPSIRLFLWWVTSKIKEEQMPFSQEQEFMNNWYKKYVIDVNS